jgi:hypothetical protein
VEEATDLKADVVFGMWVRLEKAVEFVYRYYLFSGGSCDEVNSIFNVHL